MCRLALTSLTDCYGVVTGPPAAQAGSWQVVGNSGAVALQALPFTNDLVLFLARPLNENGGGDASLTNLLTVSIAVRSSCRSSMLALPKLGITHDIYAQICLPLQVLLHISISGMMLIQVCSQLLSS